MKQFIRWGLLSTASVAELLIKAIKHASRSELIAVASRNIMKAQTFAKENEIQKAYGSYEALLNDPEVDVIYNALPNKLHAEWTIKSAEAGKHVLCEKPIVTSLSEFEAVEKAASINNVTIFEGLKHLHHPQIIKVTEMIKDGRLGTVRFINSSLGFHLPPEDKTNIRIKPNLGGGALWDVGVYANSLSIIFAQAGSPVEVWAKQIEGETGVDLSAVGEMRFANGVLAQILCSFQFPFRYQHTTIVGSRGIIQIKESIKSGEIYTNLILTKKINHEMKDITYSNSLLCELKTMEACVIDGNNPIVPLSLSRLFLRSVVALYKSVRSGQSVMIQA